MNPYSIPPLICAVIAIIVSVLIYVNNRKSFQNITFSLVWFTTSWWQISWFVLFNVNNEEIATVLVRLGYTGIIFIPILFFHFFILFLNPGRLDRFFVVFSYSAGLFFETVLWTSDLLIDGFYKYYWGFYPKAGFLHPVFLLLLFVLMLRAFYILMLSMRGARGKLPYRYNQIRYMFLSLVFFAPASSDFIVNYGINLYPPGFLFVLLSLGIVTYAIVRYHLMDINVVFKRTIIYSISAGLLTGFFIVLVLTLTDLLSRFTDVDSLQVSIVAALAIAILFHPLKQRVEVFVDRIFYKTKYDYYDTIQKVSNRLATAIELKDIYSYVVDKVYSTLGLRSAAFLSASNGGFKTVYYKISEGRDDDKRVLRRFRINRESQLVWFFKEKGDVIIMEELSRFTDRDVVDAVSKELNTLDCEVIVPVMIDGSLDGMFVLGGKMSGDIFSEEDISLLRTISNSTALSIKTARIYKEKLRSERLATIGVVAATLAHEIKNPLASIKTFSQLLPERYNTDREFRETFAEIIPSEIHRIDMLVTELLNLSKQQAHTFKRERIDVTELMEEAIRLFSAQFSKAGIEIKREYTDALFIEGDRTKLKQALINLVSNSYHAMDKGGVLRVRTAYNGNVNLTIQDSGAGISEEDIDHIFEPFYTTRTQGIGLGLTISKKIIEDNDGTIKVMSKPETGTTFVLSFRQSEGSNGELNGSDSAS